MSKLVFKLASAVATSLLFAACTTTPEPTSEALPTNLPDETVTSVGETPAEGVPFTPHSLLVPGAAIELSVLGQYQSGVFQDSAAEIVTYDPESQRGFVINAGLSQVDVLNLSDPSQPTLITSIDASDLGGDANSVAVKDGIVAFAVGAADRTEPGVVAFLNTDGELLAQVTVGALPDALTWSPDGRYVVVVNEGEPSDDYTVDTKSG